jgi:CRP/FNR family cyclic AMP-dependent transcriptional regulator
MKTILLIEDNDFIRENTAEILTLAGYAVRMAENGKIGVEAALTAPPDLVVCDITMPLLDGYGVLHVFRQHPKLASVPFIFLTAKSERTDLRRGMDSGADDFLTKPFDDTELLNAISSRLNRFDSMRAESPPALAADDEAPPPTAPTTAPPSTLASLSEHRKGHIFSKKQPIYFEGDEPARAYFVKSGRVKTLRTTPNGKELITGFYGPGEFFGYLPLLQHLAHCDSAVAVEDTSLVYIAPDDFMQLLTRNSEVGQHMVQLLASRVSEQEDQLLGMAYHSVRRRVADMLLRLHEQAAATETADIHLSRDDLAAVVGTTPESLIRTLSEFKNDGLIELSLKRIRVLQPDKLRQAHW